MNKFLLTTGFMAGLLSAGVAGESSEPLAILTQGFPRTIFFRNAEAMAVAGMPAAEFDALVGDFGGIVAKAFDEEKYGLSVHALPYFRAYKQRQPRQLVLLHVNGAGRDPRPGSASPEFFAGHWLHYGGCILVSDCPAGSTEVRVADAGLFQLDVGKRHKMPDDVTICALNPDGTPDWRVSEYAKVVSLDAESGRLTLRRGMFGSKARDWTAKRAYIAAVVSGGSFPLEGDAPQAIWTYNFSLDAPRDTLGRGLIDVWVEDLAAKLNPGGPGDFFDGVVFDVMPWEPPQRIPRHVERAGRGQDTDGDGKPDFGVRDGVNRYGAGVEEFLARLRERLGPKRLILRDSGRRAAPSLSGVESEGWPTPFDLELREWSSGMNDHDFGRLRGARPQFSYIHYKYAERQDGEDNKSVRLPFARARLVLAAAQFLGEPVTTNNGPPPEPGEPYGLFDELRMGVERRHNWLGRPVEPARALALDAPDLLRGSGAVLAPAFRETLSSVDATVAFTEDSEPAIAVAAKDPAAASFSFQIARVPVAGPDLILSFRVKAAPMRDMPPGTARRVTVRPIRPKGVATPPEATGDLWTWADGEAFDARFHFRGMTGESVDFRVTVEDSGPLVLSGITAHAAADAMAREFEHGLVLANPSLQPFTFDLARLYPGRRFRRLQGSASQDASVNNGQSVDGGVTLAPRDGLFLVRD